MPTSLTASPYQGRFNFWAGLAVGLNGTAICGCLLAWWHGAPAAITSHETLVASLLAIVAAWIPVLGIAFQTRETSRIAAQERLGRATRTRALLSQPLSDIHDYAVRSVKVTAAHYGSDSEGLAAPLKNEEPLPLVPFSAVAAIGEAIEHAEQRPARGLALLLEKQQVQRSRLMAAMDALYGRSPNTLILTANIDEYLMDSIELIARCNGAFGYARFTNEEVEEPTAEMMVAATRETNIYEEDRFSLYELIERRWGPFRPATKVRAP